MKLIARGQLQHHFWGDYSATVYLEFDSIDGAALVQLSTALIPKASGIVWKQGSSKYGNTLGTYVTNEQLDQLIPLLVKLGADRASITSVAHSIDYGDPFEITIEVEDPRQLVLL